MGSGLFYDRISPMALHMTLRRARKCSPSISKLAVATRVYVQGLHRFGPGKADLLHWIEQTGSLAEAARKMEMSYMRAWRLVRELQASLRTPAVVLARGRGESGGAQLTVTGRELLAHYRELKKEVQACAKEHGAWMEDYFLPVESAGKE